MRVKSGRTALLAVLFALSFLGVSSSTAFAGTAEEIAVLPTVDALNRNENPLSNGGKWSVLNWAANTGQDTTSGWGPSSSYPTINGAYWNAPGFTDKTGDAAAITMQTAPGSEGRYVALWLNMDSPGSVKSGYQLRWTVNAETSKYTVKLSKWVAGAETVLASNASVAIPTGTTLAISDTGGTVTAWQSSGGSLTSLLSASDTTHSSGYAGIEGSGNASRSSNFKAGRLLGAALPGVPVLDSLWRNENPLASADWSKTSWAGEIGVLSTFGGYKSTGSALASAYWDTTSFTDPGEGLMVSSTVYAGPTPVGQYLGLWLNMPNPGTAKSGYEARVTGVDGTSTNYKVELSKWVSGTRTVLGTKTGFSLPNGSKVALTGVSGTIALWTGTSSLSPVISATDGTYSSGYTGLEANGSSGRQYDFRAGSIAQPPDTTITSGLLGGGNVLPDITFTFTATEPGSTFECAIDGGSYGACTSPKSYEGLSEGSHTFSVRAKNFAGTDLSPAGRTFTVHGTAKALPKVPLLDNLERNEVPLATSSWSKTNWGGQIGGVWMASPHGYGSTGPVASAFWNPSSFNGGQGTTVAAATVGTGAYWEGEYLALWLNMPSPGSAKSGYEARFTKVDGSPSNYNVELSKWVSGTRTVLASKTGFSLPVDTTMVLTYGGGSLGLWTGTSSFTRQLYAVDTTYPSGHAGLEVMGGEGTQYNFRAGLIDTTPPTATVTSGPSGKVFVPDVSFSFDANEAGSTFECSMDSSEFTACTSPKAYQGLSEGTHQFRVRATDPQGNQQVTPTNRNFQVALPPETTITSPQPSYTSHETPPVTFTADEAGSTFKCKLDTGSLATCTSPYSLPSPQALGTGWHTVEVVATDKDGNTDATPAKWTFNTDIYPPAPPTSKLVSPGEGRKTSHYYTLKAEWGNPPEGGGVTGVTFQIKLYYWQEFKTIPAEFVLDGTGQAVSWPLAATSNPGHTEPVFFDYPAAVKAKGWAFSEEDVKFRAVLDGGQNAAGASEAVTTEYVEKFGGVGAPTDAAAGVGPANVDLLTGQYTITRTDVSIPIPGSEASLEFARTYESNYRSQKVNSMALGGMWQPSAPVERAYQGESWTELLERHEDAVPAQYDSECIKEWEEEGQKFPKDECMVEEEIPAADWIELRDNQGAGAEFEIQGSKYIAPEYLKEFVLTKQGSGPSTTFELADPDGVHTVFVKNEVGIEGSYRPKSVSWQATAKSARMVYEHLEGTGEYRLSAMIAPAPAGVTCSDWESYKTAGCRTLTFQYSLCTCGGWQRLSSITYYNASGNTGTSQKVAEYEYDPNYRLIAAWDPRVAPALKETYAYKPWVSYKLVSLTPPGEEPWQFAYEGDERARLESVSRATLLESPSTAQTTIVYGVPTSGEGAPYDMSPGTLAKWGQADYPVDATAVFPPTEVPDDPPSDYTQATIHYLDPDGNEVNTASPPPPGVEGDVISTSETDVHSNVVRSLSPQSRLLALEEEDSVARSKELDSHAEYEYSEEGARLLKSQSWGPLRDVRLESGETVEARTHTTVEYDKGFEPKEGETWPNLPTKETTAAAIPGQADKEAQVSETVYDWTLRMPTEHITDPSGLNLRTKTVYDSAGQIVQSRLPAANSEGTDAHTTRTVYYAAPIHAYKGTEFESCDNSPAGAGLPCVTYPAAAPTPAESNPQMPWTWYTKYSNLDAPEKIDEKTNGVLKRTTTLEYDSAGRVLKTKVTGEEGTSLPAAKTNYSSETGATTSQELVCEESCSGFDSQKLTTTYDKLGRGTEYEDADGNKSELTYDLMGRPASIKDGKGTQTPTYDEESGVVSKLVDSAAGSFIATYNADGQMTEQFLPNGLAQQITYNEAGEPVALRYQKVTGCSSACTWLEFNREKSIRGQVLRETGTLATKEYIYDKAGRLTLAKETPAEQGCTTRSYVFDEDSNRTSRITRAPKAGGACDTTSEGTKTSYSYDTADRLIGSGIVYDSLGRITSLPSTYSGGGTLSTSYYVNNRTRSQTQDGLTNTYYLDAALRQRERVQSGSKSGTEVYHYDGGSDSPVWTQEGAKWTRNVAAIGGSLGAQQKSNGEITFQIADMHGDVVATADDDPNATNFLSTQQFDEFGNPKQSIGAKFGWLGAQSRRTELPSGVIQMGVRSYVPALGRFLTPDPVPGGSANAYDYASQDPVNNLDLTGEEKHCVFPMGHQICSRNGTRLKREVRRYVARRAREKARRERMTGVLSKCPAGSITWPCGNVSGGGINWGGVVDEVGKKATSAVRRILNTTVRLGAGGGHPRSGASLEEGIRSALGAEAASYSGCIQSAAEAYAELPTNLWDVPKGTGVGRAWMILNCLNSF